jgi:hypothetical protein
VIITPIADADTTGLLECHTFGKKRGSQSVTGERDDWMGGVVVTGLA